MRLFAEEGMWKCCLSDNDGGRYAFLSSKTLEGLLRVVEAALKAGSVEWRPTKKWK